MYCGDVGGAEGADGSRGDAGNSAAAVRCADERGSVGVGLSPLRRLRVVDEDADEGAKAEDEGAIVEDEDAKVEAEVDADDDKVEDDDAKGGKRVAASWFMKPGEGSTMRGRIVGRG